MSSSNPSITIIGSLNYDLVTYTNKVPKVEKLIKQIHLKLMLEVKD